MGKILGLDLGSNSIGWAYIDLPRTEKRALRRKYQRELVFNKTISKKESTLFRIKYFISKRLKVITLSIITTIMFALVFISPQFWQFWINLGIGSLIATISLIKE